MKSRAATQAIIEKNIIYLITIMVDHIALPIAATKNVKDAYGFAKLAGRLATPNKSYRATIRGLKKDSMVKLWDVAKHGDTWPEGDYVDIRPIKML